MRRARSMPPLGLFDAHQSRVTCLPWDLDPWVELNNGRTLTLYDPGRIALAIRTGLVAILRREGWGITVAGQTTRYRRRVVMFDRLDVQSRCLGWDARFLYIEQSMWKGADCTSQMVVRMAITSKAGIVAPERVAAAGGHAPVSPPLPDWVRAWIGAEAARPWPPERVG
jgi:acyl-CoA thioesterase FadM